MKDPKTQEMVKACHRLAITGVLQEAKPVAGAILGKGGEQQLQLETTRHYQPIACIKEKCMLYDVEKKECLDVLEKRAQIKLADSLDIISRIKAGEIQQ